MDAAYYLPLPTPSPDDGYEYFQPTPSTLSVWADTLQHGGPPTALLTRSLQAVVAGRSGGFSRITTDILGAIGLDVNRVRAQVIRPGRQISVIGAELDVRQADGSFRTAARASAWFLDGAPTAPIEHLPRPPLTPPPGEVAMRRGITTDDTTGIDWGTVAFIGTTETGRADSRNGGTPATWIRPLLPLVDGEPTSDLSSAFTVIDVANGIGTSLDPRRWSWMNTDTTVHLLRPPRGEWLGLDSDLAVGPAGYGATFADLYDADGFVGRSAQTVLLAIQQQPDGGLNLR
ncbi:thioesterase family protein [Gordonia sp. TBRC 11910]|uniref:Thioesterase family protein n=1 Tax=Gordonia asplenii TaxID=2725283 RepID=A0A848L325_9ACTN|nr:thioesterase family protein [Gordonia asplenii]NMO05166.1 thioesterase family protein [Gordonia asplenii]